MLKLYTGLDFIVCEGPLTEEGGPPHKYKYQPHGFLVYMKLPEGSISTTYLPKALIANSILELEKPAHASARLRMLTQ